MNFSHEKNRQRFVVICQKIRYNTHKRCVRIRARNIEKTRGDLHCA